MALVVANNNTSGVTGNTVYPGVGGVTGVSSSSSAAVSDVVVDALPYIDQGYDEPGVREAALSMVEEECRRYKPTKNYLEQLPTFSSINQSSASSFETPMFKREMERLNSRQPPEPLSMKRYELPPPAPGKLSDVTAWEEAVDNSYAQLEHQATRVINLELQLEYSCETWKSYLEVLTKMVSEAQANLAAIRKETTTVNWERKSMQAAIGSKLRSLEQAWVQLVSQNYCIERAIAELEIELNNAQNIQKEQTENNEQVIEENINSESIPPADNQSDQLENGDSNDAENINRQDIPEE